MKSSRRVRELWAMKLRVCQKFRTDADFLCRELAPYVDVALDVRATLETAIREMSSQDFEQLVHPLVQPDEWKLIMLGGFLGVMVGLAQLIQVRHMFGPAHSFDI